MSKPVTAQEFRKLYFSPSSDEVFSSDSRTRGIEGRTERIYGRSSALFGLSFSDGEGVGGSRAITTILSGDSTGVTERAESLRPATVTFGASGNTARTVYLPTTPTRPSFDCYAKTMGHHHSRKDKTEKPSKDKHGHSARRDPNERSDTHERARELREQAKAKQYEAGDNSKKAQEDLKGVRLYDAFEHVIEANKKDFEAARLGAAANRLDGCAGLDIGGGPGNFGAKRDRPEKPDQDRREHSSRFDRDKSEVRSRSDGDRVDRSSPRERGGGQDSDSGCALM